MARDFIKVTRTAVAAADLIDFKEKVYAAYSQGLKVREIMRHNNDGVNFTDIETQFGLPAGTGQTVFNLVNGAVGSMEGTFQVSDAKDITARVG